MRPDRAEWAGTGAAVLFHVVLIGALSMRLAQVTAQPELPSMEVELVEEVGLTAAAPEPAETPPAAQAPEITKVPEPDQTMPPPAPERPAPIPVDRPVTKPVERAMPQPATAKPAPAKPTAKPAAKPAPVRPTPKASRIGDDFLKGIADSPSKSTAPARPSAPRFDAAALAGIQQAIRRQIQPCADQQVDPGPGANRIRVTLNIRLARNGRLARPPQVVRTSGVDDENGRYEERVRDLAVAAYVGCAPLTGLPPELYQTPEGGWSNINMTYRLP